jgi:hypothetical protein
MVLELSESAFVRLRRLNVRYSICSLFSTLLCAQEFENIMITPCVVEPG